MNTDVAVLILEENVGSINMPERKFIADVALWHYITFPDMVVWTVLHYITFPDMAVCTILHCIAYLSGRYGRVYISFCADIALFHYISRCG